MKVYLGRSYGSVIPGKNIFHRATRQPLYLACHRHFIARQPPFSSDWQYSHGQSRYGTSACQITQKLNHADALIVEADVSGDDAPFANLPTFATLEERISPEQLENLHKVTNELGISPSLLSTQPLWQIAMVLQATQAQQLGLRAEYGIDYQLLKAAKQAHKPVIELEGASSQIELLCQLPDNGLALLDDTLTHWHTNARLLQQMMGWWLKTPPRNSELTLPNTFSQSLYDVLMHQRNTAWRDRLRAMPAGHYVVAVGALHLYGEGNLPEMLR